MTLKYLENATLTISCLQCASANFRNSSAIQEKIGGKGPRNLRLLTEITSYVQVSWTNIHHENNLMMASFNVTTEMSFTSCTPQVGFACITDFLYFSKNLFFAAFLQHFRRSEKISVPFVPGKPSRAYKHLRALNISENAIHRPNHAPVDLLQ